MLNIYLAGGAAILGLMTTLWLVSLYLKDASIVDIFWGAGFVLSAWVYYALGPDGYPARKLLAALLVTVWGLRLSIYIYQRNHGKGEDFRYREWRQQGGTSWWWQSLFKVFLLQGFLMWIISAPLLVSQSGAAPANLTILDGLGVLAWLVGFYFETMGDAQLARFKADPTNKGKLLNTGVWRYTRHPNYFGDAAQWWGFYLLAAAAGGWWTVFSPLLMTFLLVRVSGAALLEKSMAARKPGYKEYMETTSAFIPWFPKTMK